MIKMLICDFDGTLDGGPSMGVTQLSNYLSEQPDLHFVIATGRTLPSIKEGLAGDNYLSPYCIISDIGTQIHHNFDVDLAWQNKLQSTWNKPKVEAVIQNFDFLGQCSEQHQSPYKITIEGTINEHQFAELESALKDSAIHVSLTYSHGWFLDITPKGITKAAAIHYLLEKNNLTPEEVCVAGDSANDTSMLTIEGINAILVANHYQEVAHLSSRENVYTSQATHAQGVLEGLRYWQNLS
ncbi:HAD-IIB family hydrolase [Vibrio genomosp. F6]|uniref:Sucrose-phosphate synthase n=1 Tax=Vibrio genomosp. F6 str. FF-238 TaxID=1191298 RepID=A0A1E5CMH6_9VIBR|nr:HAD-IIB family hydrolase [Vibrio genomosp. F6]OEE69570.1 sucrose-phosphate synthase [Vibrio genomosp. F6 str. FF-238]